MRKLVKIIFSSFLFLTFSFCMIIFAPSVSNTQAQESCLINLTKPNAKDGLISAPSIVGFYGTGVCNQDPSSAFAPYKIPKYADLKSLYFDQSKATTKAVITGNADDELLANNLGAPALKNLIHITGNLVLNGSVAGTNTAVVFVGGNLEFISPMTQFSYGDSISGIVFIVQGDVFIDPNITTINAVIISSGFIYTAVTSTSSPPSCSNSPAVVTDNPLTVNGSLISLDPLKPIRFCRTLKLGNTVASEVVNHQVKYLVILRNLLSDTIQRWSEI